MYFKNINWPHLFISDKKVTLYRIGNHIDISKGPMIGNTDLLGRCTITSVCLNKLYSSFNSKLMHTLLYFNLTIVLHFTLGTSIRH